MWARLVADTVPGIELSVVATPLVVSPAEILRRLLGVSRYPPLVPSNEVWLSDLIARIGQEHASPYVFTGGAGNAAYSYGFNNPLALLTTGELGGFAKWALGRHQAGRSVRSTAALMRQSALTTRTAASPVAFLAGPRREWGRKARPAGRAAAELRRSSWLRRVGGAGWSPTWRSLDANIWWDDPFTDPKYLATIAALPTSAWLRLGDNRSLARRVGGRVLPAEVASRVGRGGQGEDLHARLVMHEGAMRQMICDLRNEPASVSLTDVERLGTALTRVIASPSCSLGRTGIPWYGCAQLGAQCRPHS